MLKHAIFNDHFIINSILFYDSKFSLKGPPYAIIEVLPNNGPITGGTELILIGIDYIQLKEISIRFCNSSGDYVDCAGKYMNKSKIAVISPNFQKFSPDKVEIRISFDGDPFTTSYKEFFFFSVTNSMNSVIYGPGLLNGHGTYQEMQFDIQAR